MDLQRAEPRLRHEPDADQVGLERKNLLQLLIVGIGIEDDGPGLVLDARRQHQQADWRPLARFNPHVDQRHAPEAGRCGPGGSCFPLLIHSDHDNLTP